MSDFLTTAVVTGLIGTSVAAPVLAEHIAQLLNCTTRSVLDTQRDYICPKQEAERLDDILDDLRMQKRASLREDARLKNNIPQHVQKVLAGKSGVEKSPSLLRSLAKEVGFDALGFSAEPSENPWFKGFQHLGPLEKSGLWPNGKALSEAEQAILQAFHERQPDFSDANFGPLQDPRIWHDKPLLKWGWETWKEALCDGTKLVECPRPSGEDLTHVSYGFYSPTKYDPTSNSYKKVRLIIDERGRNELCPSTEHISLVSHRNLTNIVAYCINREAAALQTSKDWINRSISEERTNSEVLFWDQIRPRFDLSSIDLASFIPAISKVDLAAAYY